MIRVIVAAALFVALAPSARAFCIEPTEPFCLSYDGDRIGKDRYAFDACRDEVKSYLRKLNDHRQCVVDEMTEETRARAKKVVDRFNCYAEGGGLCL